MIKEGGVIMKQRKNKIQKYVLKQLVVAFLVLSYLAYGADPQTEQNNQKSEPAEDIGKKAPNLPVVKVPMLPPTELFPDIPGVTLSFHRPPNKEEIAIIMKYATEQGLKKHARSLPTLWVLIWDKPKDYGLAARICDNFPKPPSLEACRLNRRFWGPASVSALQSPPNIQYNKDLCGLAKDHHTYWAQNIIGADLLREELKKKIQK